MNQEYRKQRRQIQVIAVACREVAGELRERAGEQSGQMRQDLKDIAESQEIAARQFEADMGGPLPVHAPPTEAERQEARQTVYSVINEALTTSGAPKVLAQFLGLQ